MSVFPGGYDDLLTNYTDWTGATTAAPTTAVLTAEQVNRAFHAIEKIEALLGLTVAGSYATVAARLDALEAAVFGIDGGLPGSTFPFTIDGGPTAVPTFVGSLDGGIA